MIMFVNSIFCGMGLLDRAFHDTGFIVSPLCEINDSQRELHKQLCGKYPMFEDVAEIGGKNDSPYDPGFGLIGGPPCQAHSRMKAMRGAKFGDMTSETVRVMELLRPAWFLFENVVPLKIPGAKHVKLDAMHFGKPHQSRPRWFTYSPNITPPSQIYNGTVDTLMAYPVVAGRIYGPKRGAILQGYPGASSLKASCKELQLGLANAVHYGLALAWAESIKISIAKNMAEKVEVRK